MDTQSVPEPERPSHRQRYAPLWRILIGLGIALLVAWFFFSPPVLTALTTPIAAVGLDLLTAGLIAALFLSAGAALVSALLSRQRLGTAIGTGIVYSISYILPFLQQELLPHHDPGGHIEVLNTGMLAHTIAVLLASGLLCAYLGAIVGSALSEVLFDPIWQLAQLLWHKRFRSNQAIAEDRARQRSAWGLFSAWIGLFALLGLLFLSSGIGDLLFYSPDVGLHSSPTVATHGALIADSMVSPALHGQRRSFLVYL
ncbi:MAG TPA: hypothetical protein VFV38_35215, partial [Ktedonobacteraceae bacterium]|nr:hypothetical protein [Ktedonobacteraceae bacterium]